MSGNLFDICIYYFLALWQRLAMRLGDTLPLKDAFMQQIWKICLELHDLTFFELESARETLVIFDRYELEYMSSELEKVCLKKKFSMR